MLKSVIPQPEVDVVSARITYAPKMQTPPDCGQVLSLQHSVLDAPLNANGAHDLSGFQPGLEWYDLDMDTVHITDIWREQFAVEAGCNSKVLEWASVPVTDENVFAQYPPYAVFEFAASIICTK